MDEYAQLMDSANKKPKSFLPFTFSESSKSWIEDTVANTNFPAKSHLTIITYNVWFTDEGFKKRVTAQIQMFKDNDADIIVMQEVIPKYINIITQDSFIRDTYQISHLVNTFGKTYGVYILSKKGLPLTKLESHRLPSYMERDFLLAEYQFQGHPLCCSVVHLESLDNSDLRKLQLLSISKILQSKPCAILMGDFNFDSEVNFSQHLELSEIDNPKQRKARREELYKANIEKDKKKGGIVTENEIIAPYFKEYVDVWPTIHGEEKGYTFDSERNLMLGRYEQMRYDRILFKSPFWEVLDIQLIGMEPIKGEKTYEGTPLYPSDHFGLMMKIALKQKVVDQ